MVNIMDIVTRNDFIEALVNHNGFIEIAPHTLQYKDSTDIITVFNHPNVVIITADGPDELAGLTVAINRMLVIG
jgi:hypothetical protein